MHQEIKICQGVYITDYRKNEELKGLDKQPQNQTKDVGLLLDQAIKLESQISQLIISNDLMKEQPKWEQDQVYLQAITQNLLIIIKKIARMKQVILCLVSLKYQPQNQQQIKIFDVNRLMKRENDVEKQYDRITKKQIKEEDDEDDGVFI